MHDPNVVAWEVPLPWPERREWDDARPGQARWTFGRRRRTNAENLGQPVYAWFRPCGWRPRIAGRAFRLKSFVTIWHVEPHGRDSGEVCKHWTEDRSRPKKAWRWHVWHWHVQVLPLGKLKRYLFERCIECGRRYPWSYAPISHQWEGDTGRWFRVERHAYHHECSALVSIRRDRETLEGLTRYLFSALCIERDAPKAEVLAALTDPKNRSIEFNVAYRLTHLLGYERDENYELVPTPSREKD